MLTTAVYTVLYRTPAMFLSLGSQTVLCTVYNWRGVTAAFSSQREIYCGNIELGCLPFQLWDSATAICVVQGGDIFIAIGT